MTTVYKYDEANAVIAQVKQRIRRRNLREAADLCAHLRDMLQAREALMRDGLTYEPRNKADR